MPWLQTVATHYHTKIELPGKLRTIKGLVVCNDWDVEPLDLKKLQNRGALAILWLNGLDPKMSEKK